MTGQIDGFRREALAAYEAAPEGFQLSQPRIGMASYHVLGLILAGRVAEAERMAARVDEDVDQGMTGVRLQVDVIGAIAALAGGRVETCRARGSQPRRHGRPGRLRMGPASTHPAHALSRATRQ